MADFDLIYDQPQATGASREGKPQLPEPYDEQTAELIEATSCQNLLAKNISWGSQTHTKRTTLGHPISTPHQPPINFSMVCEGLYRSGYPQCQDYPFIQGLKLKTIVTLVNKELPDGYREFIEANRITHKIFDMAGTKKEEIPSKLMGSIHAVVSNPENYPLLIHCNHGKHRTGCVVGVFRKFNQWDMERIIKEYSTFAEPKVRETDLKYLAEFELPSLWCQPHEVVSPHVFGRFYKLIFIVILALFAFYPLSKFKVHEPRPKSS
ncbi:putative tyrosine-protein phosphatase siw14 protein [Rosellinia necatrix]|uniref:Putative tyrosine-protein phosphatase siw14 protein n=1 Tax=Rosellinia necatrix TaxID=77044 RepID=A0A1S7UML8_ROSNE|nr:putative tyrosine-protein phosphatase siw14 protein [Rosellinia necatrix]